MSDENGEMRRMLDEMRQGSTAAFDRFYEKYASLVLRIALKVVDDRMEAEDICHDVFIEIMNRMEQFDPNRGSIEAWLAVKTKSRCLDRLRRKQRTVVCEAERVWGGTDASFLPAEDSVLSKLDKETVMHALTRIPRPQRSVLYGKYYEEQTQRELSEELQYPLGTVKSLIKYGLNNVRKQLDQLGWLEPEQGVKRHD